jgi:hypothetical protein
MIIKKMIKSKNKRFWRSLRNEISIKIFSDYAISKEMAVKNF